MIYKSKAKIQEINESYRKNFLKRMKFEFGELKIGPISSISLEAQDPLWKAVHILKKTKKYLNVYDNAIEGYYYEILASISYIGFQSGSCRALADPSFIERIDDDNFFKNDILLFEAEPCAFGDYKRFVIKCRAENIRCFSTDNFQGYSILTPNTSDKGLLKKDIQIKGVVRIDDVCKHQEVIYANPLYLDYNN